MKQHEQIPTQEKPTHMRAAQTQGVNTHFALSVTAVCLSCFLGLFAVALALAALILSLRAQDQVQQGRTEDATRTAYWSGLFGWITVIVAVLPIALVLFFGGAILTGLAAFISAM